MGIRDAQALFPGSMEGKEDGIIAILAIAWQTVVGRNAK